MQGAFVKKKQKGGWLKHALGGGFELHISSMGDGRTTKGAKAHEH